METGNSYENGVLRQTTGDTLRPGGFFLTDLAIEKCVFLPGDHVLDVGCGYGATVDRLVSLYQLKAFGIDPSETLLNIGLNKYPDLSLSKGKGEDLPFSNNSMDGISCECSLSLMTDVNQAFQEINRVLKPTGRLIVHDVYARNSVGLNELHELNLNSCLRNTITEEQIRKGLSSNGLQIVHWQDHSQLLVQLMVDLIMTHGSVNEFWIKSGGCTSDPSAVQVVLKKAKVGYFQLIAETISR
ncbi:DVU_1556 family methyltransferase [Desulfosporosinus fructosivorans]